jgi:hypothetical protein
MVAANIENCRQSMLGEFEAWLLEKYGELPGNITDIKDISKTTMDMVKEEDEDMDALAYIKAKRNVSNLHKAKKQMLTIKHK